MSQNLFQHPKPVLSLAAKRQLYYFEPKGASKRILPRIRPPNIILPSINNKSAELLSPVKLPKAKIIHKDHSAIIKSTMTMKKLVLISSREASPIKLELNCSQDSLEQISEIMDSCDKIQKINQSDILLASKLIKRTKIKEKVQENLAKNSIKGIFFRRPSKDSVDRVLKDSFETTLYIEKNLNRKNSVKKLKEKIMPWKKISIV